MLRTIVLASFAAVFAAAGIALVPPARAQIGTIFSDPPPRPPGSVPRRGEQPPPDDEEEVPELPQGGRVLPAPNRPMPGQGAALPGPVQSQPLAPVPGTTVVPQNASPGIAVAPPQPGQQQANVPPGTNPVLPGLAPGQRQPKGVPQPPATLQPGDEVVTEPPAQKIVNKKASFAGLDKITGRIIDFDEAIGETVQFGALRVKTDACYTRPATEAANTDAFVEVDEITLQGEVKRIFSGWMFASSPGLHAVEHPVYDIWLTDCKEPETTVVSAAPTADQPKPAPSPVAQQKRPPGPKQPRPAPPPPPAPPPQQQTQQQPPPPPPPQSGGLFGIFR
ncbi:DUF2155 domain-containing protein [Bradyrhizobium sp. ARR65]|uniref:DUF2155 domain-containing protein n=1 Tax=Bradyrhizobium sp. ARR65 TaxID=1040989 RepID=UPI0004644FA7|nr:DUF2155 domain-containing protein [Bradyrhizobium sp. ARR65]